MPSFQHTVSRRNVLRLTAAASAVAAAPSWAQNLGRSRGPISVTQIVDGSLAQLDLSKDIVVGCRAAFQEVNQRGGVRGRDLLLETVDTDGSIATVRQAMATAWGGKTVALLASCGDGVANRVNALSTEFSPGMANCAPWLQTNLAGAGAQTFPLFAGRTEQIAHALKSMSNIGLTEVAAVFANASEQALHAGEFDAIARTLRLRVRTFSGNGNGDLRRLGAQLDASTPAMVVFVGGTPELIEFTNGLQKQARQRFVVALADVNPQTVLQLLRGNSSSVITTQVVPLLSNAVPVVREYRASLAKYFDEPPTPQSLAGYVAARYLIDALQQVDGPIERESVIQALRKVGTYDLGGFRVGISQANPKPQFVTQSMFAGNGRMVG